MNDRNEDIEEVRGAVRPYISVSGAQMNYDSTVAVKSLSFDIAKGEFVAIVGPSGCGKSTLLHAMSGLMRPESGSITISGYDVTRESAEVPPIGYVFQEPRLLPWRTVRRNIELAMAAASVPREVWDERISRFLSMLRIDRYTDSWPLKLSGGQQQRVVTARALRQELLSVWAQEQRTVVFVTHSLREALFLADRILVLTKGPAELLKECVVDLPRPRDYDDPRLAQMEAELVGEVMGPWGYR